MEDGNIYDELRGCVRKYLKGALRGAIINTELRSLHVVIADDVISSRPDGVTVLGFGGACGVCNVWAYKIQKVM